ncbi:MAG: outer membrane protein transport protein [Bacteroidales bacterium]|nr:outer membrane protein transport protein [Bacteroidales bacterium]
MKKYLPTRLILTALIALACGGVFAQANVDSPYSMFGIGQVRDKTMNARLKGMGGVANAMHAKNMLNAENPASYAMIDTLAFLFDAGIYAKSSTFSTSSLSERASSASFDYVAMGFAFTNWWKVAVGAQPYSNVGYNIVTSSHDEHAGNYSQYFQGDGGLNQVFVGNAFKIGRHFSIGANANYVFGDSKSTTTLTFPDSTYVISSRRSRDVMIKSFMFDYGVMYHGKVGNNLTLSVGATYDQKINLKGTQTVFVRTIEADENISSTSTEYLIDTVAYTKDKNATFTMPHGFGFGVSLQKDNRWTLGADFNWTQWSAFERNGINERLQDAWGVAVGGEFIPSSTSLSSYWTRVSYRLGGFYEQTYLNINGQSINKMGVDFGMSLPIPRSMSKVDLGLEVGKCGTKSANLIRESYVNLTVGVSVFERWFMKRKYK